MTKPGGWSPYETKISNEEMQIFKKATKDLTGVGYEPVAVATQVVSGMNYNYFCNATVADQSQTTYPAMLEVTQTSSGDIKLSNISPIQTPND